MSHTNESRGCNNNTRPTREAGRVAKLLDISTQPSTCATTPYATSKPASESVVTASDSPPTSAAGPRNIAEINETRARSEADDFPAAAWRARRSDNR